MPQYVIGTEPINAAPNNPNRFSISAQFVPSSIIAGNTGLVYGKWGSAPAAVITSNTWDFVLNAGATDGSNLFEAAGVNCRKEALWLVSDTAGQVVNIVERNVQEAAKAE